MSATIPIPLPASVDLTTNGLHVLVGGDIHRGPMTYLHMARGWCLLEFRFHDPATPPLHQTVPLIWLIRSLRVRKEVEDAREEGRGALASTMADMYEALKDALVNSKRHLKRSVEAFGLARAAIDRVIQQINTGTAGDNGGDCSQCPLCRMGQAMVPACLNVAEGDDDWAEHILATAKTLVVYFGPAVCVLPLDGVN